MVKLDTGNLVSGAISGASFGSQFGPWGTGIGAVVGGAASLFSGKKKKKPKRISTLDPQQQGLYDQYTSALRGEQGGGQFNDLFNFNPEQANDVFNKTVARPAYRQFEENVIPQITGQYRANNLMQSSYSGEALSKAGRNVQEGLDAQRANYIYEGQQAAANRKQRGFENIMNTHSFDWERPQEGTPGVIDQILSQVAPKAGEWFGQYLDSKMGGSGTPKASAQPPEV
jgi:hypothetical protein